jgi:hypothetical protein
MYAAPAVGLLLGAVIAFLEFTYYRPLAPHGLGPSSFVAALLTWSGDGVALAVSMRVLLRRKAPAVPRAGQVAATVVVGTVAGVCLWQALLQFILRERFGVAVFLDYVGQPVRWPATVVYHVWLVLLVGGLATAAYVAWLRRERMLALLRDAELARERSQQVLAQAQLLGLRARVDPELLYRKLSRLHMLYESDPAAADRLMEELISYLRKEKP